jgi:hypothetical protein
VEVDINRALVVVVIVGGAGLEARATRFSTLSTSSKPTQLIHAPSSSLLLLGVINPSARRDSSLVPWETRWTALALLVRSIPACLEKQLTAASSGDAVILG